MPVTQQDIAAKIGISRRTVSYALNGGGNVGEEMRTRIMALAEEMGYQPNRAAQALVTGRTNQIAFCVPTLETPFHAEFVRYFEAFARHTSYDLLVTTIRDRKTSLAQLSVDGILALHSVTLPLDELTGPVVLLQSPPSSVVVPPQKVIDQVWLGLSEASAAMMRHLLDQKPKRVAFVTFSGMVMLDDPRYAIYLQVVEKAGLTPEVVAIDYDWIQPVRPLAHQTIKTYFAEHGYPDALFCANDEIAIGAYRALRELGRKVPDDILVCGCDDIPEIEDLYPSLTSIRYAWEEVCSQAWDMLMTRIENPALPPRQATFESELVIRNSSLR